jgi:hypothetical protein
MVELYLKQGDLFPLFTATLERQNAAGVWAAADLTAASAVALVWKRAGVTAERRTAAFVSRTLGRIVYPWGSSDTTTAGTFALEVEVTWAAGGTETFPNDGYMSLKIAGDLD